MDNKATATEIGKRVEDLRESRGISRREFALSVNIPLTSYRDRELGRRDFEIPQLQRISAALKVELDYWFRNLTSTAAAVGKPVVSLPIEEASTAEPLAA